MDSLRSRLAGAGRIAVVGIGDELSPVDRLGMLAAREIDALNIPGIRVFFAGTVPESMTGPVRTYHPDHILLLDAADTGAPPGTLEILLPGTIRSGMFSTHALPLSVVMEYLSQETGAEVTLLGIQPDPAWLHNEIADRERGGLNESLARLSDLLRSERLTNERLTSRL